MKVPPALQAFYYSFPIQLVLLHLRKYQVLLIFWLLLFSTVNGQFLHKYGADSLFLAPEYLDNVGSVSAAILGVAIGIFIMSWNITTFILHSGQFRFLATTTQPFLRYCLNNSVIPLAFLVFFLTRLVWYSMNRELMPGFEVFAMVAGFLAGLIGLLAISFLYFFGADRTIMKRMAPTLSNPIKFMSAYGKRRRGEGIGSMRVDWYLSALFRVRKTRNVTHYSVGFLESIFKQHHVAAVVSIFIAFVFLVIIGFLLDYRIFQLPAGASITLFFAILIALSGAFSMFLQSWSIPAAVLLYLALNTLYTANIIDARNKAYGLVYNGKERAAYNREALEALCTPEQVEADRSNMLAIMEKWKARQAAGGAARSQKPVMYFINVSGGGNRSAAFTMNVLQRLDSITGGSLMKQTFLMSGASGGMIGAAYFRELYREQLHDASINLHDPRYVDDISRDLLNATFSSFVARDLAAPAQRFSFNGQRYLKDRAWAFENRLNDNTRGLMSRTIGDYAIEEEKAVIPLLLLNSVITRDGKKMVTGTQPLSFMMIPATEDRRRGEAEPDAVDFGAMFRKHQPDQLRMLTALRMNATFPYVLPNVWLPTDPVIDVMDAGMRDNFGLETTLRFISHFREWIMENTGGAVIISIRDRQTGGWENPYEATDISEIITKPALLIQHNWHKLQDYYQNDQLSFSATNFGGMLRKVSFQYVPRKQDDGAALNFHLTKREKQDIAAALDNPYNSTSFEIIRKEMGKSR